MNGRVTARAITSKLGAIMKGQTSNEALPEGKTVVIKCAASATDSVGVTLKMLDRLDSIIGAFQLDDNSFELWSLWSVDTLPVWKYRRLCESRAIDRLFSDLNAENAASLVLKIIDSFPTIVQLLGNRTHGRQTSALATNMMHKISSSHSVPISLARR